MRHHHVIIHLDGSTYVRGMAQNAWVIIRTPLPFDKLDQKLQIQTWTGI